MSGFYNKFHARLLDGSSPLSWTTDSIRCLLLRNTGAYTFDPDDDFVSTVLATGVEITVASYARQVIAGRSVTPSDANDNTVLDYTQIQFGALESGQTVSAYVFYEFVTVDGDSNLLYYNDGTFNVILAASALVSATTIYVDPLQADIANGAAVDFGGGATATLSAGASRGDRTLSITALGAAATVGDNSTVQSTVQLPAALGGGNFNIDPPTGGFAAFKQRNI